MVRLRAEDERWPRKSLAQNPSAKDDKIVSANFGRKLELALAA